MKKLIILLIAIWLCILALFCVLDLAVLKNIHVEVLDGVEIAPYRLLTPPILSAESVPERGSYSDLVQQLGPAAGCNEFYGGTKGYGYYDLQWGGSAHFTLNGQDNSYSGFTVAHTRLGTGRWLILPGIMLLVAIVEVAVFKPWKKKKCKADSPD